MCTFKIHVSVIEVIDRAHRHCLWRGSNFIVKKNSLAAWDMVCNPKNKGELGIINSRIQNKDLLLKHLHEFYNKHDLE